MILQALYDYYKRCADNSESGIVALGFAEKEIPFIIDIGSDGVFKRLEDTRESDGKKKRAKTFVCIKDAKRSGTMVLPNIGWDKLEYVLGFDGKGETTERSSNYREAFKAKIKEIEERFPSDADIAAVSRFYDIADNFEAVKADALWKEALSIPGCNMTFRVAASNRVLAEDENLAELAADSDGGEGEKMRCLITGKRAEIAKLHTACSLGGKSGVKIVNFQVNSGYDSYNKSKGYNAPVSIEAELCYTTALNTLLAKDSRNKCAIGETTFIYWGQRKTEMEKVFNSFFESVPKDNPNADVEVVRAFLESYKNGRLSADDGVRFFVLGMSPNVARVMIRFWWQGSVSEISANMSAHFEDLKIVKSRVEETDYVPLFNLLANISNEYKISNLPPKIYPETMQSIMSGKPYPQTLHNQCMRRIRADRKISYQRASILKACLNRKLRQSNKKNEREITMALDTENKNQAYLCGRLFAVLEKIQSDASGAVNASIKDKYYGSASTTPVAVFGRLLDLSNHHEGKLSEGSRVYYRRMIQEIMSDIDASGFPKYLSLDDQSRFALGYYHQMRALYTKKDKQENE